VYLGLVEANRKLQHQQDLSAFSIAVVVLEAMSNTFADLQPLIPGACRASNRTERASGCHQRS
jgi:hypothetical protein